MTITSRRTALGALAGVAAIAILAWPTVAPQAQDFPRDTLTLVVNWPAGGGMDRAGRLVAEFAKKRVNVSIAVVNVAGAGGATGVRHVADAKPDGYTVGIAGASMAAAQYMNENANALDEIDFIAFFGLDPAALQVRADTGIETLKEFIEHAKSKPGAIKNGNDAPGGVSHTAAALLERKAGIKLTKVPYKGYAPTVAAIISGEVQAATLPVHQLIDQHKAGEVRILGVMANERHFMAPDVPTFKEQGVDLVAGDWRVIYLPNGVPAERRAFLEKLFVDTMSDPEFQKAAENAGFVITPLDGAATASFVKSADEDLYPVLKDANLAKVRLKN